MTGLRSVGTIAEPLQVAAPAVAVTAGAARRDITPPIGIFSGMWGAAAWDQVTAVHRPLTATALATEDGDGTRTVLVSIDHGAWRRREDEWALRSAVLAAAGLAEHELLVTLTHTHSSCSLCSDDHDRPGGEHIHAYLEQLTSAVVEAVCTAMASMRPVAVQWSTGECDIVGVRDQPHGDRYLVGWDQRREPDRTVVVGRISEMGDGPGHVVATLVNFACHGTCLGWENSAVSPDYVGAMRELVEDGVGGLCLFVQGADGDLAPKEQYSGDPAVADRAGRSLGHAVLAALADMDPVSVSGGNDRTRSTAEIITVDLPLKPVENIEALADRFWPDIDQRTKDERVRRATWRRLNAGSADTCRYPIWIWRAGGAVIVAQPGEGYSALQRDLRRRFPGTPIVVASLANGPVWTYLPTRDLFAHNAYQVWHTPFQPGCHEAVLDAAQVAIARVLASPSESRA